MNYLAHLYFSALDSHSLTGNLLPDFTKKIDNTWHINTQIGYQQHQFLDKHIDKQPVFLSAKKQLAPNLQRFSGIINDVFLDYYLASHWQEFHPLPLKKYALLVYAQLQQADLTIYPQRFNQAILKMQQYNWLCAYQHQTTFEQALYFINKRSRFETPLTQASQHFDALDQYWQHHFKTLLQSLLLAQTQFFDSRFTNP